MSENLYGLLNVAKSNYEGGGGKEYQGDAPIVVDNDNNKIQLSYDDTLTVIDGNLSVASVGPTPGSGVSQIKAGENISLEPETGTGVVKIHANKGTGGTYHPGEGIKISDENYISTKTWIINTQFGKGVDLTRFRETQYYFGYASGFTKYDTGTYLDLVEVTADTNDQWGNMSYNVYTPDAGTTSIYVWAYHLNDPAGGDVCHAQTYMWTFYNDGTGLQDEYEKIKRAEWEQDIQNVASGHNMYIPNKKDIIISKHEQSFDLGQYIDEIYYSGQTETIAHKVDLNDCHITPYNTSELGIQKIDIRYIGELNEYNDPMSIIPTTVYMKVVE